MRAGVPTRRRMKKKSRGECDERSRLMTRRARASALARGIEKDENNNKTVVLRLQTIRRREDVASYCYCYCFVSLFPVGFHTCAARHIRTPDVIVPAADGVTMFSAVLSADRVARDVSVPGVSHVFGSNAKRHSTCRVSRGPVRRDRR